MQLSKLLNEKHTMSLFGIPPTLTIDTLNDGTSAVYKFISPHPCRVLQHVFLDNKHYLGKDGERLYSPGPLNV